MKYRGSFRIKAVGPYNFDLSYSFYRRSRFETVDRFADRYFRRPLRIDGWPVLVSIPCGDGCLTESIRVDWAAPEGLPRPADLRHRLMSMLYADFDLGDFYGHKLDPVMKRLTRRFIGFRPMLTPDIFEASAWAIIGQQVNLQFAYRLKSRLVSRIDRSFIVDGETYYLFPTAADIASLDYADLREMRFSGRKAEYLIDLARLVAAGDLDLERLKEMEYDRALERLLSIRGLGPWSANYILLRGTGHRDAFPFGDSGINHAVTRLYGLSEKPDIDYLTELSRAWRPYRSLATFYLWKSL